MARRSRYSQEQREIAIKRYLAGVSPSLIAAQFHCSTHVVRSWLHRAGVQRPRREFKEIYCPLPTKRVLERGLGNGNYIFTELGLELRCNYCGQYWPADTSFFHKDSSSSKGLHGYCTACADERRHQRKFNPKRFDRLLDSFFKELVCVK